MQLTAAAAILLCCVVLSSGMKDAAAASSDDDSAVTFGSVIKLRHKSTGAYLHSHKVAWGSGSKQQSVTAMAADDDRNSYWVVKEGNDEAGKALGMRLHASVCECVLRVIKCQVLDTCDRGTGLLCHAPALRFVSLAQPTTQAHQWSVAAGFDWNM